VFSSLADLAEVAKSSTPALKKTQFMTLGILLALLAAFVYGFLGISFEIAGKRHYDIWNVMLYKQITGFFIGVAFTAITRGPLFHPTLLWLGLLGATTYVITLSAYLVASRQRDIAANWTIVNLSVMLPILISVLWFKDAFTATKVFGTVATLASIVAIGGGLAGAGEATANAKWIRYIAVAFLFNGWLAILFRFVPEGYSGLFTVYFYGWSIPLVLIVKLIQRTDWKIEKGLIPVSILGAGTHWAGIMLTMAALSRVGRVSAQAGVIVYPITNGLVIPVGVLLGVILLKQSIQKRTAMGVVLGMAALALLSL
jgi:drug/metabolite transporter (DMT)-like permease